VLLEKRYVERRKLSELDSFESGGIKVALNAPHVDRVKGIAFASGHGLRPVEMTQN
jgi:hypothetical protein